MTATASLILLVLTIAQCARADETYTLEALADQVKSLPGASALDLTFNQFSGYLSIPGTSGNGNTKNMHYWMVESMNNPSTDPVAFWTNGGPGCSGLLGFLSEQGPFRPNKDMSLSFNKYAWNTISNMVFIESPCGVGFSYSEDPDTDYHPDDASTAADNYALIQGFLDRFPQFRKNDVYITSESYGGHYMPTLAKEIVDNNAKLDTSDPKYLKFRGFAVGNPATTSYSTIPASLETYWGHQLVSKPLYDDYEATCVDTHPKDWQTCEMLFLRMYREIGDLNPYALDYPVCTDDSRRAAKYGRNQRAALMRHELDAMALAAGYNSSDFSDALGAIKSAIKLEPVDGYEPCVEDYMTEYLNLAEVKEAIHVKSDIDWVDCSRTIKYKQSDGPHSMTSYYQYLIDGKFGLDILVYSGDDDDVCATIGTQSWIWDLGYTVASQWKDYTVDGQTAGYITKWKDTKLALATVHGAGHEVPTYKPEAALWLWASYLKGELTNK